MTDEQREQIERYRREFEAIRRSLAEIMDRAEGRNLTRSEWEAADAMCDRADVLSRLISALMDAEAVRTLPTVVGPRPNPGSRPTSRPVRSRSADATSDAMAASSIIGSADGCG